MFTDRRLKAIRNFVLVWFVFFLAHLLLAAGGVYPQGAKLLGVRWDQYENTGGRASHLKLMYSVNDTAGVEATIDGFIPLEDTSYTFNVTPFYSDSVYYFVMQAVNRNVSPPIFSVLSNWAPYSESGGINPVKGVHAYEPGGNFPIRVEDTEKQRHKSE